MNFLFSLVLIVLRNVSLNLAPRLGFSFGKYNTIFIVQRNINPEIRILSLQYSNEYQDLIIVDVRNTTVSQK